VMSKNSTIILGLSVDVKLTNDGER
jgi:hypothetical protein